MTDTTAQRGTPRLALSSAVQRHDVADAGRRAIIALRRRKWLFIGVFVAVTTLVILFAVTRTKLYTATASMVVNTRELNVAQKDQNVVPDAPTAEDAADTEIEIMRAPAVAIGTVNALDLTRHPLFAEKLANVPARDRVVVAAAMIDDGLKISRPSQSNVVAISYTAPDATLAQAVANQIGRQYLAVKQHSRRTAVDQVNVGMEQELDSLRSRLEQAEAAVADYTARNNLLSTQGVTFAEQELSLYKQQEATMRAALAEDRARLSAAQQQAHGGSGSGAVTAVLQSPVVQNLRNQRALVAAQIADLSSRYHDNHPDLIKLRDQEAALDNAITAEMQRQLSNLSANVAVSSDREANAIATVGEASGTIAHNDAAAVHLNELQRKADALKLTYQSLLERRNAISAQALIADEDARIFSPATLPLHPSYPRKSLIGLLGLVLAGMLATAAVWVRELFDRTLVTSARVEQDLGLPHIANLPETGSVARPDERDISAIDLPARKPLSLFTEQLRSIRLTLLRGGRAQGMVSVGITSARPNEGKTTLSIALARASALAGSRVLLIDADIRRPSIAAALGLPEDAPGLVDVLRGDTTPDAAIVADTSSPAFILPAGRPVEDGQALFDAVRIEKLLASLEGRFDLVLFDTAPTLPVADARLLLRQLGGVLMLVRWNATPRPVASAAIRRLRALDIEPIGVVLTRVNMRALAAFGEGDDDRYHADYAHYYR